MSEEKKPQLSAKQKALKEKEEAWQAYAGEGTSPEPVTNPPPPVKFEPATESDRIDFRTRSCPDPEVWREVDGKHPEINTTLLEPSPMHPGLTAGDALYTGDPATDESYDYVHKPKHYSLFDLRDIQYFLDNGREIDVCAVAEAAGLDKDAYMFMVLKYVLRQEKPGEPRRRDVEKIREYCDIWLAADDRRNS